MSSFIISIKGAILDGKMINGQPTCITMTGDYAITAESAQSAMDRVVAHVKTSGRYPVRVDKVTVSGLAQSNIDRIVKRGGTKKVTLVR